MEVFGNRLKELRISKKVTQTELAKAMGVDQRSISNWEKNIREPNLTMLCKLANFFDVSCDFLLGNRDYY